MKGVYPVYSPLFNDFNLELKMQYSGKLKCISGRKDDYFMPSCFFFFFPSFWTQWYDYQPLKVKVQSIKNSSITNYLRAVQLTFSKPSD